MVNTLYRIRTTSNRSAVLNYLSGLTGYVNAGAVGGLTIEATFDHADKTEILDFLWNLAAVSDGTVVIDPNGINKVVTLSQFNKNQRYDTIFLNEVYNQTLNNLSTTYVDIFPNAVKNLRFPIDTNGFSKAAVAIGWNKNGGAGIHDVRLVDTVDESKILTTFTDIQTDLNEQFNINLSLAAGGFFEDTTKFLKIQARSSNGTDDPTLVLLRFYLRR